MPDGLKRLHQSGQRHFVTVSCFRRQPFLGSAALRERFEQILFEARDAYGFELTAYVVMPEHVHLILTEPSRGSLATVLQVLKQRYSVSMKKMDPSLNRRLGDKTGHPFRVPVWETRYYDFNLTRPETAEEKVRYIHANPVKRGLVERMEDWPWSSYLNHLAAANRRYREQ